MKEKKEHKAIRVAMPGEIFEQLQKYCKDNYTTMSHVGLVAIINFLKEK